MNHYRDLVDAVFAAVPVTLVITHQALSLHCADVKGPEAV